MHQQVLGILFLTWRVQSLIVRNDSYQCKEYQFECNDGFCVDDDKSCDGIKNDCSDGLVETGSTCPTYQLNFTCFDGSSIDVSKLCNERPDCGPNEEDEMRCEQNEWSRKRCIDGSGPNSLSSFQDTPQNISECWTFSGEENPTCEGTKGICGFDSGHCGMKNEGWRSNAPNKNFYKILHDHSFEEGGSYYIALPKNRSQFAVSTLSRQWNKRKPHCMQFWYIVGALSSLKVCHLNRSETICPWSKYGSFIEEKNEKRKEWTFGQVEIPGNLLNGTLQIVGNVSGYFAAIDDVSFIETSCLQVTNQTNPSCYFDFDQPCHHDSLWSRQTIELHGEKNSYLNLAPSNNLATGKILSPVLRPKADGWKCLRLWINSRDSAVSLNIFYNIHNNSRDIFNYTSHTPGWVYFQSPIPEELNTLQVVIEGNRSEPYGSLSIDDITYSKHQCKSIPLDIKSGRKECLEYRTWDLPTCRKDRVTSAAIDDCNWKLPNTLWYRISRLAGIQVSTECSRHTGKGYGWINGTMPAVVEGRVLRTMCIGNVYMGCCCLFKQNVTIRNCGGYFVYHFPKVKSSFSVSTEYSARKLTLDVEWRGWTNNGPGLNWEIMSNKQFISISKSTHRQQEHPFIGSQPGIDVNSPISFTFQIELHIESFTVCFWISSNETTPNFVNITFKDISAISLDVLINRYVWRHVCVASPECGIYVIYVDGVANKTTYTGDLFRINEEIKVFITSSEDISLKLTSINACNKLLSDETILYMSYDCRSSTGNIVAWDEFFTNITSSNYSVIKNITTSCYGKGNVLSIISNATTPSSAKATYLSPPYPILPKFVKSPARCLRFQYRLFGPGAKVLKLYQVLENKMFPWRPIWMNEDNSSSSWQEGRVTLAAVTEYQIAIEGQMSNAQGLISIGALHTTEEYCAILPRSSNKGCNEVLRNLSGIIMSPCYPSFYSNNTICNSTIIAKQGYVIRLEITEFELEKSTRCENDFVDVYDSGDQIGRYCGTRYPPIIQSTTKQLSVVFRSNAKIERTGFLANYTILKDDNDAGQDCLLDCPSQCECRNLPDGRIGVLGKYLKAVPGRLPRQTSAIFFSGNSIYHLKSKAFKNLTQLSLIDLSYNRIIRMDEKAFFTLPSLSILRLKMNFIKEIVNESWSKVQTLQKLDIGHNLISAIGKRMFLGLWQLKTLNLRKNLISIIHQDAFENNTKLTSLYLHDNRIREIPDSLFRNQKQLKVLEMHNNKLETFRRSSFRGLSMLENLTLHNNSLKESRISSDAFLELQSLKYLKIDSFILCCYAEKSISALKCESEENEFSSCEDMLKTRIFSVGIWIQAVFALIGNLAVILWRTAFKKKEEVSEIARDMSNVQSLLLRNLAVADFLMGIYLLFIGVQDALWRGEYFDHDVKWRSGIKCQIAGAISTLSSEVSVMILVVLTADRFSTILFPFSGKRLNFKSALCVCSLLWVIGILIAFSPLVATSYFHDKKTDFSFYGRSTVCLPLQLSSIKAAGWEYSVAVFMVFNGAAILFIIVAYVAILIKIQMSSRAVPVQGEPSSSLGSRIMFIVLTDFFCWMPVIVLGVLSLIGQFDDKTGKVYAVIAVFVLPLNSSINPVIYTFATPQARKAYHRTAQALRNKLQKVAWKRNVVSDDSSLKNEAAAKQDNLELEEIH